MNVFEGKNDCLYSFDATWIFLSSHIVKSDWERKKEKLGKLYTQKDSIRDLYTVC